MCMSVYLPRSAVIPTMRSSARAACTRACPNGAAVVFWPGSANDAIIAEVFSWVQRMSYAVPLRGRR